MIPLLAVYRDVERLPPIHWLQFKAIRTKPIEEGGYWRPPDWIELWHHWLDKGREYSKKLFVIGEMEIREGMLSPDHRYYYIIGDRTYVGRIGQPKLQKLSQVGEYYRCRFSPNSRYLVGCNLVSGSLRLYDYRRGKQWVLTEHYVISFGWYPDSRHVWYSTTSPSGRRANKKYYVQDVQTKKRRRLTTQEAEKIHTEWDLLNPRFLVSYPQYQGNKLFAYSCDNRVRVKVDPYYDYSLDHLDDQSNVFLERKDGTSFLLLKGGTHPWVKIYPQDVSVDGGWVLLVCGRRNEDAQGQPQIAHDLVVIETKTRKLFYPFQEDCARVIAPRAMHQVYWFHLPNGSEGAFLPSGCSFGCHR